MKEKLFAPETLRRNSELVAAMESVMLATPPEAIAAALHAMADRPDSTSLLPQIKIPTLLICGEHDKITPPAEMPASPSKCRKPASSKSPKQATWPRSNRPQP